MLQKSSAFVFWISIIVGLPILIWIWSIGIKLQKESLTVSKLKMWIFKISIIFPLAYGIFFFIYYIILHGEIIMSLHLSAMLSIFYAIIFAAKTLKSAELNREATLSDYLGEFFLIWFFPFGIWILQPRIHKLIKKEKTKKYWSRFVGISLFSGFYRLDQFSTRRKTNHVEKHIF